MQQKSCCGNRGSACSFCKMPVNYGWKNGSLIMAYIDLNCDMGEGLDTDAAIMPFISSANIACGYHAGNRDTMLRTATLARQHQVAIGAHPAFADRENFGRTEQQLPDNALYDLVTTQVYALEVICRSLQARAD